MNAKIAMSLRGGMVAFYAAAMAFAACVAAASGMF